MNTRTRVRLGLLAFALAAIVAVVASAQYTANHTDDERGARPAPTLVSPSPEPVVYFYRIKVSPQPRDVAVVVTIVVNGKGPGPRSIRTGYSDEITGTMDTAIVIRVEQRERWREPFGVRCELYRRAPGRPEALVQVAETAGATTIKCATENAR